MENFKKTLKNFWKKTEKNIKKEKSKIILIEVNINPKNKINDSDSLWFSPKNKIDYEVF